MQYVRYFPCHFFCRKIWYFWSLALNIEKKGDETKETIYYLSPASSPHQTNPELYGKLMRAKRNQQPNGVISQMGIGQDRMTVLKAL